MLGHAATIDRARCAVFTDPDGPSRSQRLPATSRKTATRPYRLGAWWADDAESTAGDHPFVGLIEVVGPRRKKPTRPATWLPTTEAWSSPSASASSSPVCVPGGRTTTHRLASPSFVVDGASSTNSNPSRSTKNSHRRVVLLDDERHQLVKPPAKSSMRSRALCLATRDPDMDHGWPHHQRVEGATRCMLPLSASSIVPPRYEASDPPRRGVHDEPVEVLAAGLHPRVRSQANGSHYTSTRSCRSYRGSTASAAAQRVADVFILP